MPPSVAIPESISILLAVHLCIIAMSIELTASELKALGLDRRKITRRA